MTSGTTGDQPSLAAGAYTTKGTSCTGLTATTGDYAFTYAAKATGFVVAKAAIAVSTVAGSQTYGSTSPSFTGTYTRPAGATLTGTIGCTTVTSGTTAINQTLGAGSYTVKATTCTGLTATTGDYAFTYAAKATGFVVAKAIIAVSTVGGTQTYGSSSPSFSGTYTRPAGATVTGTITCTTVTSGTTAIAKTLAAGSYTLKATTCSGAHRHHRGLHLHVLRQGHRVRVAKAPIAVSTVSGTQTYDSSSPSFTGTYTRPTGATVTGTITCTKVTSGTTISKTLAAGIVHRESHNLYGTGRHHR